MPRAIFVRRSAIHGRGIFAARDLPAEHRVMTYRGRLLTHAEADARYGGNVETGHTFLFTLNEQYVIDGNQGGNIARWINHSCAPNCRPWRLEHASGDPARDRVVIETLRPIRAGEELTYNYGITLSERHTPRLKALWACLCGVEDCTGTLLQPKRPGRAKSCA